MVEALAFSGVTVDVVITKGESPALDRCRLSLPDGAERRAVAHVIGDLPHLVVESEFGIDEGLWGTLARCRPCHVSGQVIARAAVDAVVNRWGDGPDTPDGVRDRMRARGPEAAGLADSLGDEPIRDAAAGVRKLYRQWRALPPGGALRLTWPLGDCAG